MRGKLDAEVRRDKVPADRPIPAHLLGNMWAQEWGDVYGPLEPYKGASELDVDAGARQKQKYDATKMVKLARGVLHVARHPARCRRRSGSARCSTKPRDREVVCHASAWDVDYNNDLRIKMCIKPTQEDLRHDPPRARPRLLLPRSTTRCPMLFQDGANDGFHEAIGDTIALSMTPAYLKQIGPARRAAGQQRRR